MTAFVGTTASGPADTPVSVSSIHDFVQAFGAVSDAHPVGRAIDSFFLNGGAEAVVVRVQPTNDSTEALSSALLGDPGEHTGLHALTQSTAPRFGLLCIPPPTLDATAETPIPVYQRAAALCAEHRAMLILDPPPHWADAASTPPWTSIDPAYFALGPHAAHAMTYFPRLAPGAPPVSGAVAGVIARTDAQRGVWKAPAGPEASLAGISALALTPSAALYEALNQHGINGLRTRPNLGVVVWGARTLLTPAAPSDPLRYIPVQRLKLFLEASLIDSFDGGASARNEPALWTQLREATERFLMTLFRRGAFAGSTPRDAYFIQCGLGTTMTSNDVATGRVHLTVGFAPLKPAEFVLLKLTFHALTP